MEDRELVGANHFFQNTARYYKHNLTPVGVGACLEILAYSNLNEPDQHHSQLGPTQTSNAHATCVDMCGLGLCASCHHLVISATLLYTCFLLGDNPRNEPKIRRFLMHMQDLRISP